MNNHRYTRWLRQHWLQVAVVVLIAGALRFVNLSGVPQGIFHDEAWSGAKALDILNGEAPAQVYFPENNGMDAFHVYLIALLFKFTGPVALGSRIVSAAVGTLTVLATYWLAWELPAVDRRRHAAALIAAVVYGIMLTAIATARSGWHSPSFALLATLCLAALARGRRLGRRRWYVIAGVLAGLAQYTYPSARLLPVLLIVIALLDLASQRGQRRTVLIDYALAASAAAVVFLPLGVYFIQNPQWLFERAQQTSAAIDLGQNTLKTLLGFVVRGSTENLHNLPGRPLLDPVLGIFFVVGLGVCAVKHRAAQLILLSGVAILSLAVVLTEAAPLTRRWTAVFPLVAIIAAIGLMTVINWIAERMPTRRGQVFAAAFAAVVLFVGAGWSIADYFGPYAANPQLFWEYDSGITQVADHMRGRSDTRFFLTPYDRFYEVVMLTLAEQPRAPIQSYNGMACALFPAVTDRVTEWLVITEKDQRTLPLIKRLFPMRQIVWQIDSPVGTYARAAQVPAGATAVLPLSRTQTADFAGKIELVGFDVPREVAGGKTLRVTLALKSLAALDRQYSIFVHLRQADGTNVSQGDRAACDGSLNEADWRPGDVVLQDFDVPIPPEIAAGRYPLVIGLYEHDSGRRLPVSGSELPHDADGVTLGTVEVK